MNTQTSRLCTLILIAVFISAPQLARAEMISTQRVVSDADIRANREKVRAFVDRADAERSLIALGVKPELAKQRVDALTNDEVMMIAGKIDSLPAGGDLGKSDLIIILLVALLVVVAI